jgi:hypothetical protein
VYAFSIIVSELVSRREPYSRPGGHTFEDIALLVMNRGADGALVRPEVPASCPEELFKVMRECWAHSPAERPTFNQLADHCKALDLAAMGTGTFPARELLLDLYPKHVSFQVLLCH